MLFNKIVNLRNVTMLCFIENERHHFKIRQDVNEIFKRRLERKQTQSITKFNKLELSLQKKKYRKAINHAKASILKAYNSICASHAYSPHIS